MAIQDLTESPLTQSQAGLTAKIGSMKALLSLPQTQFKNIPKAQQISTSDYLLKLFDFMGISPEGIFTQMIDYVFNSASTELEKIVIKAVANAISAGGIALPNPIPTPNPTSQQIAAYNTINANYLAGLIPPNFLANFDMQMAKDLTIMIFGPNWSIGNSTAILEPDQAIANSLLANAVAGLGIFSSSVDPVSTNQTLEYNRVALQQQLNAGQVQYNISCQQVKISLPPVPTAIFQGGGMFSTSSTIVTPTLVLSQNLPNFVNNQIQNINNETNANKGGITIQQTIVEKLMQYIGVIVLRYLPSAIFAPVYRATGVQPSNYVFDYTVVSKNPSDTGKAAFLTSMWNSLYKQFCQFLLVEAIKQFKTLIGNYFAAQELELQKIQATNAASQFALLGAATSAIGSAEKLSLSSLSSILS